MWRLYGAMVPLRLLDLSMSRPSGIGLHSHVGDGHVETTGNGGEGARRARASFAAALVEETDASARSTRFGLNRGM